MSDKQYVTGEHTVFVSGHYANGDPIIQLSITGTPVIVQLKRGLKSYEYFKHIFETQRLEAKQNDFGFVLLGHVNQGPDDPEGDYWLIEPQPLAEGE